MGSKIGVEIPGVTVVVDAVPKRAANQQAGPGGPPPATTKTDRQRLQDKLNQEFPPLLRDLADPLQLAWRLVAVQEKSAGLLPGEGEQLEQLIAQLSLQQRAELRRVLLERHGSDRTVMAHPACKGRPEARKIVHILAGLPFGIADQPIEPARARDLGQLVAYVNGRIGAHEISALVADSDHLREATQFGHVGVAIMVGLMAKTGAGLDEFSSDLVDPLFANLRSWGVRDASLSQLSEYLAARGPVALVELIRQVSQLPNSPAPDRSFFALEHLAAQSLSPAEALRFAQLVTRNRHGVDCFIFRQGPERLFELFRRASPGELQAALDQAKPTPIPFSEPEGAARPGLSPRQERLLTVVTGRSRALSRDHQAQLSGRIQALGFTERDLEALRERIRRAPITINFKAETRRTKGSVVERLSKDGRYLPATAISTGASKVYIHLETSYFGDLLVGATMDEHPVYAAVNVAQSAKGGAPLYGECFLELAPALRERSTMTIYPLPTSRWIDPLRTEWVESQGSYARLMHRVGTCEHLDHVLDSLSDAHLSDLLDPGRAGAETMMHRWVELQVHGPVDLSRDCVALVLPEHQRGKPLAEELAALAQKHGLELKFAA